MRRTLGLVELQLELYWDWFTIRVRLRVVFRVMDVVMDVVMVMVMVGYEYTYGYESDYNYVTIRVGCESGRVGLQSGLDKRCLCSF